MDVSFSMRMRENVQVLLWSTRPIIVQNSVVNLLIHLTSVCKFTIQSELHHSNQGSND